MSAVVFCDAGQAGIVECSVWKARTGHHRMDGSLTDDEEREREGKATAMQEH